MNDKIGRNQKCPCGSGKKYKRCHLLKAGLSVIKKDLGSSMKGEYQKMFDLNSQLRVLAGRMIDKGFRLHNDKSIFISFCLGKTYKTHKAILILCEAGYGQDAAMLVRSMVELLITLLYILADKTDGRLYRYFDYDWILQRKMYGYAKTKPHLVELINDRQVNPRDGDNSIEEIETTAKLMMEKHNYGKSWSEKNIREMSAEVGKDGLYDTMYVLQSQLIHTSPRATNEYISRAGDKYVVSVGSDGKWIEESLVSAFDCLYSVLGEVDKFFELGLSGDLDNVAKEYSTELEKVD